MPSEVAIRDVTPRDGLQSESPQNVAFRVKLATDLAKAGLVEIEVASFVSPKAVPSMADGAAVADQALKVKGVRWWALVPNAFGASKAIEAGIQNITITVSASNDYSLKNTGKSKDDAINALKDIKAVVDTSENEINLDVVISSCFGSPSGDVPDVKFSSDVVNRVSEAIPEARITLADTTGTATPRRVKSLVASVEQSIKHDLGLHLHNSRGSALANAIAGLENGVTRFDTAIGGLGGSPFASNTGGNLATEELVMLLEDQGITTGINIDSLLLIAKDLETALDHPLASRVSHVGLLSGFGT